MNERLDAVIDLTTEQRGTDARSTELAVQSQMEGEDEMGDPEAERHAAVPEIAPFTAVAVEGLYAYLHELQDSYYRSTKRVGPAGAPQSQRAPGRRYR